MKYQVLFSQENNEKVFINVCCCSCDGDLKVKEPHLKDIAVILQ